MKYSGTKSFYDVLRLNKTKGMDIKMRAYMIQLQCMTNMHVGNGDVNYNVIDNEVERDPVTGYPTINPSGVKGALQEYFKQKSVPEINSIFGAETEGRSEQGMVKFLGADMLAIPGRSSGGEQPFYLISTKSAVLRINELADTFIKQKLLPDIKRTNEEVEVEGFKPVGKISVANRDIYIMEENQFRKIDLPVIARNKLDNGISKQLWYEEIVPHDSIFFFPVISEDGALLERFIEVIRDQVVQFGGNASIGYGLCKIKVYGGEA